MSIESHLRNFKAHIPTYPCALWPTRSCLTFIVSFKSVDYNLDQIEGQTMNSTGESTAPHSLIQETGTPLSVYLSQ